jgi:hypothetical protein
MRYYTRCTTEVQKVARKVLRHFVRLLWDCRNIDPSKLSSDTRRQVHASQLKTVERIVAAFHAAKTDEELLAAMALTECLCDSMTSMQECATGVRNVTH